MRPPAAGACSPMNPRRRGPGWRSGEIFRIIGSNNDRVGLRNVGKANASFLDGSGRMLAPADLKKAGFTKAFDNSVTPPKAIQL